MGRSLSSRLKQTTAFSLVELLVSISVLALGLIAFLSTSSRVLQSLGKIDAYYNTESIIQEAESSLEKASFAEVLTAIECGEGWTVKIHDSQVSYHPSLMPINKTQHLHAISLTACITQNNMDLGTFQSLKIN